MQSEGHADRVTILEVLLDTRMSRVSHQISLSLQLGECLYSRDEGTINRLFALNLNLILGHGYVITLLVGGGCSCLILTQVTFSAVGDFITSGCSIRKE